MSHKLVPINEATLRDPLFSVKTRTDPPRRVVASEIYKNLQIFINEDKKRSGDPILPKDVAKQGMPVVSGWNFDESSTVHYNFNGLSNLTIFRQVYKDDAAPLVFPQVDDDEPSVLTLEMTLAGSPYDVQLDKADITVLPGLFATVLVPEIKSTMHFVMEVHGKDDHFFAKNVYCVIDAFPVPVKYEDVFGESHWSDSNHSLQLRRYLGSKSRRYDALYWKCAKSIHSLLSSDYAWSDVHCLVSFPDLGIVNVAAGENVQLYVDNPRALFVVQMNGKQVELAHISVETRVKNLYAHHVLNFRLTTVDNVYAVVLEYTREWAIFLRFHVNRNNDGHWGIRRIEVLYENVDVDYIRRHAVSQQRPPQLLDDYPEPPPPSSSSSSTAKRPRAPQPQNQGMSFIVHDQDDLPSLDLNALDQLLPNQYDFFTTDLDDDSQNQFPRTGDEDLDFGYIDPDVFDRVGEHLKKKRHDKVTAHLIKTPPSSSQTTVIQDLTLRTRRKLVKFEGPDFVAHPNNIEFDRGHRHLLRFTYIQKARHIHVDVNLKLRRHRLRKHYDDDEFYAFTHLNTVITLHFKKNTLFAALVSDVEVTQLPDALQ